MPTVANTMDWAAFEAQTLKRHGPEVLEVVQRFVANPDTLPVDRQASGDGYVLPECGTDASYHRGCHCPACAEAHRPCAGVDMRVGRPRQRRATDPVQRSNVA